MEKGIADIHTHILPRMDDGSASVKESLRMLAELSKQGVSMIAATPHFYADRENPSQFFERRQDALSKLCGRPDFPITVLPGAEVCYYQGISGTEELPRFAIGSTNLLLLEMPFEDWTPSVVNEVYAIQRDRELRVVIAHMDRYYSRINMECAKEMLDFGVLFQINASAFLDRRRKAAALSMLQDRTAHFIASDCHNMTSRSPKLAEAYAAIEKTLGRECINWLHEQSGICLGGDG